MVTAIVNAIAGAFSSGGLAGIALRMVWESLLAMVLKMNWKVVIERAVSRLVVRGLHGLASMKTNDLTRETVSDILEQMGEKRLPKLKEANDVLNKKHDPG
ncbi:hypothetical protein DN730_08085 [Marinomonas piezotolerans]|uniref:Uncharacterized protein n=1 Tax=Marinomonas piezotolerans TaxID=2213058 RepID=A0A370U9D1_9GAMM|nr:hypothetical protein [Marinomonas piezotolerans]RDL44353.1 hypothetical protein DN730_08085 [Marinomonas piezotolerans]